MDNISPNPVIVINNEIIGIIERGIVSKWNGALVAIITPINIIKVIIKFKNSEITPPKTKIDLGAAVVFKIFWFLRKVFKESVVPSEKKS